MSDMILMLRCSVSPLTTGSGEPPPPPPPPPPPAGNIAWGWDPAIDLGTTGDWYVDASVPASGDGRTPATAKKTIAEARNAASSGQVIKVIGNGVKYREQVGAKSGLTIEGYGTDKPIITGANVLSGSWTPVMTVSGPDAERLGGALASSGDIWKWSGLATASIATQHPLALNIHENDVKLIHAQTWAGQDINDRFFQFRVYDWPEAESVGTVSGKIISYTDPPVFAAYSDAQILNCHHFGHRSNNSSFVSRIASVDRATNSWVMSTTSWSYESNSNRDRYSLVNMLPAMIRGGWGFWENDDGTIDVYVWPNDPANINNGSIEYSVRPHCIDIGFVNDVAIRGIQCRQAAGVNGGRAGAAIVDFQSSNTSSNIRIEHCHISRTYTMGGGDSAVMLKFTDRVRFHNNVVEQTQNQFGLYITGDNPSPGADPSTAIISENNSVQKNYFFRIASTSMRFFTVANIVVAFNKSEQCGLSAHANKSNTYEQCHSILYWGNIWVDCDGYVTWQEASANAYLFNYITSSLGDKSLNTSRSLVDQNNGTTPPSGWTRLPPPAGATDPFVIANNALIPRAAVIGQSANNSLNVGKVDPANASVTFSVLNNLMNGQSVTRPENVVTWTNNWVTAGSLFNGSDIAAKQTDVWTDPAKDDFTIKPGAAFRTAKGASLVGVIDGMLKPKFGGLFNGWTLDCLGNSFDPASPPVGCLADPDGYAQLQNRFISTV